MDRGQKMGPDGGLVTVVVIAIVVVGMQVVGVFEDPDRMCSDAFGDEWASVSNTTVENGTYHCIARNGTRRNVTIRNLTSMSTDAAFGGVT